MPTVWHPAAHGMATFSLPPPAWLASTTSPASLSGSTRKITLSGVSPPATCASGFITT